MRVMITGARGQLGVDCMEVLGGAHTCLGVDVEELDVSSARDVSRAVAEFRPDAVVNCAAYTRVDACEEHEAEAAAVNARGAENLAVAARGAGAHLVHVSTDYVFAGDLPVPRAYVEEDPVGPVSAYGRTKLAGERAVAATGCRAAVLRTAWLYGAHGENFLKTMLRLSLAGKSLKVVADQHGSPTWSRTLARQVARVVETGATGLCHATAHGHTTWYELATRFLTLAGVPHEIAPCTTAEYPTPATRPKNSILDNKNLRAAGLDVMRPWEEDLEEFVRVWGEVLVAGDPRPLSGR